MRCIAGDSAPNTRLSLVNAAHDGFSDRLLVSWVRHLVPNGVMPGLDPGIQSPPRNLDARIKSGHDELVQSNGVRNQVTKPEH